MTVAARDLYRAFPASTAEGECPLCGEGIDRGEMCFFATGRRGPDGAPIYTGEAQIAPRDARVERRPPGCTCRGKRAHTARCGLHVRCTCQTARNRYGGSYVRHSRECQNLIRMSDLYRTLPGCWDQVVHCACASERGMTIPENSKIARGRRTRGVFDSLEDAPAPVAPAPAPPTPVAPAIESAINAEMTAVSARGPRWMTSEAEAARAARERVARERRESAARVRARVEADRADRVREEASAGACRFAVLDLSDSGEDEDDDGGSANAERFAVLDLD